MYFGNIFHIYTSKYLNQPHCRWNPPVSIHKCMLHKYSTISPNSMIAIKKYLVNLYTISVKAFYPFVVLSYCRLIHFLLIFFILFLAIFCIVVFILILVYLIARTLSIQFLWSLENLQFCLILMRCKQNA